MFKVYNDIKNNKQIKQQFTQELLKIRVTPDYNSNTGSQKTQNNALKSGGKYPDLLFYAKSNYQSNVRVE